MGEVWTTMWGFPNYEISNFGNIRNLKTQRLIKQKNDGNNYELVSIYYNKKKYTKRVGRAVWQSFNMCDCKETIDHIDRNKTNNTLQNLRCVTAKENYNNLGSKKKENKYNLTPELKALIHRNFKAGIWSTWDIMKKYGIPVKYTKTTMDRNSWAKYGEDENL